MAVVGMGLRDMIGHDNAIRESAASRVFKRGFAAMDPDRRREISRKGGASVPGHKRSFAKDRDLAADAGRKGGSSSHGGGRPSAKKS